MDQLRLKRALASAAHTDPIRTAIAMRHGSAIAVGRGMRLRGAKNVRVDGGPLKLGTGSFRFADTRLAGQVVVAGRLIIDGSVAVAPGNWWFIHRHGEARIGDGTFFNGRTRLYAGTTVSIGARCAISWDVLIMDEDFHQVGRPDGNHVPSAQPVTIGNHVLIGAGAKILKGTLIADDSVVAAGAVVAGRFPEPGCVLAGVPAHVIRRGVSWH